MEIKDAFKELARFAEARARGAAVRMSNGVTYDGSPDKTGHGMDANRIMHNPISEIIEPTTKRPWNADDTKRHVGFAYKTGSGRIALIGLWLGGHAADLSDGSYWESWEGTKYAAPIPGTDPAAWDWKPCEVEVPAEPKFDVAAEIKRLRDRIHDIGQMGTIAALDRILKAMEGN